MQPIMCNRSVLCRSTHISRLADDIAVMFAVQTHEFCPVAAARMMISASFLMTGPSCAVADEPHSIILAGLVAGRDTLQSPSCLLQSIKHGFKLRRFAPAILLERLFFAACLRTLTRLRAEAPHRVLRLLNACSCCGGKGGHSGRKAGRRHLGGEDAIARQPNGPQLVHLASSNKPTSGQLDSITGDGRPDRHAAPGGSRLWLVRRHLHSRFKCRLGMMRPSRWPASDR